MFEMTTMKMVEIVHKCMQEMVKPGDTVCDCTMGHGNDTLALAKLVGSEGMVYAFDIQEEALRSTEMLLREHGMAECASLILDSHSHAADHIHTPISFFVFNLGYLPDGDQSIITEKESTISAVAQMLSLTKTGGGGCILSYYGHDGGTEEKDALEDYLKALKPKFFNVMKIDTFNRKNTPPVLYMIKKLRDCE